MFNPGHAALPCSECQSFIYDIKTAKPVLRRGEKQKRLPSQPTPCAMCPKGGPEREAEVVLSPRNLRTFNFYFAARATGLTDEERTDPIVRRNFAILEQLFTQWDRKRAAEEVGLMMAGRYNG